MLGSAFAQALAGVAVAVLQWYWGRKDIRDSERAKIALEGLEQVNKALDWKSNHPVVVPDGVFDDFASAAKPTVDDPPKTGASERDSDSKR